MSAWVVSKAHIDALVTAGLINCQHAHLRWEHDGEGRQLDYTNADEIGSMLWAENVRSVQARYPDILEEQGDYPGPIDFEAEQVFAYRWQRNTIEPVAVLKAIDCYQYQSCEHGDAWRASEAFQFCEALKEDMIGRLPGYREAPWGIDTVST